MPPSSSTLKLALVLAAGVAAFALIATFEPVVVTNGNDIPHIWLEGVKIAHGVNPYASIEGNDHEHVDRYFAVYPPGFYLVCAATFFAGVQAFPTFLTPWWFFLLAVHVGVASFVALVVLRRSTSIALALGVLLLLTLNRWALEMLSVAALDVLVVPLIAVALVVWERHRRAALAVFGATLAIKHVAVLFVPLVFVWLWLEVRPEDRRRELLVSAALLLGPVFVVSLPFLVWNAPDYFWSLALQTTRVGADEFRAPTIDQQIGISGVVARLPFFACIALAAWANAKRIASRNAAVAAVAFAHVMLAPVLFSQYVYWLAALGPLVVLDIRSPKE